MAKIPTIGAGTTQLQSPKLTSSSSKAMQTQTIGAGRGIEAIGGAIEKSASLLFQKMGDVRNYTGLAQAEAFDSNMFAGELLKAETAVDKTGKPRQGNPDDFKDHDEIFRQSEESLNGFFSNKETEARYKAERQKNVIAIRAQIARKYQQNMIDAGKAAIMDKIAKNITNYANAPDKSEGVMVMAGWKPDKPFYEYRIKEDIKEAVKLGFLTQEQAQKMEYDSIQDSRYSSFLVDFRANPEKAEKKFFADGYGLDIETSEKVRIRLKEIKTIRKEAEGELYGDMSLKVMSGQMSDKMINDSVNAYNLNSNEGITPAHGKSLKAALYRDITQRIGTKEYKKYKTAIDFIFSNSQQDKIKGYEAILAAYEGGLTNDEAAFLTKILKTKKDILFANKAAAGKKMLEQLLGARPKDVIFETKTLLEYARRIANGADPEQAAKDTTMDIIKQDHPAVVLDPDLSGAFSPSRGYRYIPKVKQEKTK